MKKLQLKIFIVITLAVMLCLNVTPAFVSTMSVTSDVAFAQGNAWDYDGTYYDNLNENLSGSAFRSELAQLITSTHNTGANNYDRLKSQFNTTDADPETGTGMLWFYTGTKTSGYGGSSNREHVWPKDAGRAFPAETGPGCDLQHLRPTDTALNSTRNNLSFDELPYTSNVVKENGSTNYGDPANGADRLCYYNRNFFYPAKGYRGATARILMYMQTRWGDQYNLTFVDSAGHCKTIGKISTLFKWHLEEPPTASEIYRNQKAYEIQGNRNPFIDHPEYAAQIYCNDGNSYNNALNDVLDRVGDPYGNTQPLVSLSFEQTTFNMAVGQTLTVNVIKNPTNAKAILNWTSSNTNVATVSSNGVVTAKAKGTTTITATDADTKLTATATITVKELSSIEISGKAAKTQYTVGETFDPTGLTVMATYSDATQENIPLSNCLWLDAVTGKAELSVGTTHVLCKVGNVTATVNGITVKADSSVPQPVDMTALRENTPYKLTLQQGNVGSTLYIKNKIVNNYYMDSTEKPSESDDVYVQKVSGGFYLYFLSGSTKTYLNAVVSGTYVNLKPGSTATSVWQYDSTNKCIKTAVTVSGSATEAYIGTYNNFTTFSTSTINHINGSFAAYLTAFSDTPTPPVPDFVTLNQTKLSLKVGENASLNATSSGAVSWSTSNSAVATVDGNGKITAVGEGTANITVKCGDASAICVVTVTPVPDFVTLNQTKLSLKVGENAILNATASGAVSWSTSNSAVATVDGNGKITAVGEGTANITVKCGDASTICVVTVTREEASVSLFSEAVAKIDNANTVSEKYEAIKTAITEYHRLSESDKLNVTSDFEKLQSAINSYNATVSDYNQQSVTSLNNVFRSVVALSAVVVVMSLLKRRLF